MSPRWTVAQSILFKTRALYTSAPATSRRFLLASSFWRRASPHASRGAGSAQVQSRGIGDALEEASRGDL
jgi:hypothetical protein